jgi:SulP family sulfate permease
MLSMAGARPMVGDGGVSKSLPANALAGAITRSLFASAVSSALTIAFCLSYAALIFSGPLAPWLGYGITLSFLSAAVSGFVVALRSSLPFTISGPDSATSAVTATLAAGVAERLATSDSGALFPAVLIALPMSAALAGLLLCTLGLTRAGRAIRFVPYPVVAGFLGASGCLIVSGGIQVVTDRKISLTSADLIMNISTLEKLAAAVAVAILLFVCRYRLKTAFALPGVLLFSIVFVHLALLVTGIPLAAAEASGWTFTPQSTTTLSLPALSLQTLEQFPWKLVPSLTGDLLAVAFVTTISLLLNITGIEFAANREASLDRELNALGMANAACAALGGYVTCISLSRSILNYAAGASGRLSGLVVAGVAAAMLATTPTFLAYVPKCALGGLLLYIGAELVYRWLVASWRQLVFLEYVSLAAIALIIVCWGFVAGVLIGIITGCATFSLNASRVSSIKFSFDGTNYRSSLDRDAAEIAFLNEVGQRIQGISLQSYLFFGTANRLYQHVKQLFATQADCRFLVFDFKSVVGIDSSATHSFRQIKRVADECGAKLVLVNLGQALERTFRTTQFMSHDITVAPDLDRALELCENTVIAEIHAKSGERGTLEAWLNDALGSEEKAALLARNCKRIDVRAGDLITRQGEPANSMHFIVEGRVNVLVKLEDGRLVRVRSLGPRTTIGEMGLITGRARSATVEAEGPGVLYELTLDDYEQIKSEHPVLSHALLNYIVTVMSERLAFASRVIGVLQR